MPQEFESISATEFYDEYVNSIRDYETIDVDNIHDNDFIYICTRSFIKESRK
eukprot:Pgem_evm1s18405